MSEPEAVTKAREYLNSTSSAMATAAEVHLRNLLTLREREEKEPETLVDEENRNGKWLPVNRAMNPQMGGTESRKRKYRRVLRTKKGLNLAKAYHMDIEKLKAENAELKAKLSE